jgi:acid stress-induced BolA-like protein IbaG/YrbA
MEKKIEALIKEYFDVVQVKVEGDGYHYLLTVESPSFEGLNKVKRQQMVYKALHSVITSGDLHAVSIQTYAPGEV